MTSFYAFSLLGGLICMGGVSGALASEFPFFDMTVRPRSLVVLNITNAQTYGFKDNLDYFMGLVIGDGSHDVFEVESGGALHLKLDQEDNPEKKQMASFVQETSYTRRERTQTP